MLPLGIPLYVLLFAEIYLLFIPKSPMIDSVIHGAPVHVVHFGRLSLRAKGEA